MALWHNAVWHRLALSLVAAFMWAGCAKVHSVRRTVQISQEPLPESVVASIQQVPGVSLVHVLRSTDDSRYVYRKSNFTGILTVASTEGGRLSLTFYSGWTDSFPPPETVRQARLTMDSVYSRLSQYNPSLPPASRFKEEFRGLPTPGP